MQWLHGAGCLVAVMQRGAEAVCCPAWLLLPGVKCDHGWSAPHQALGTYQSDHVAPPHAVAALLNGSAYQQALGTNPRYAPASLQYTLPDIFFQLENLGAHVRMGFATRCSLLSVAQLPYIPWATSGSASASAGKTTPPWSGVPVLCAVARNIPKGFYVTACGGQRGSRMHGVRPDQASDSSTSTRGRTPTARSRSTRPGSSWRA